LRRLYLRFYFALLASLAIFTVVSAVILHRAGGPAEKGFQAISRIVGNSLPPADASPAVQQAALARMVAGVDVRAALRAADGRVLAAVGEDAEVPRHEANWMIGLPDGRRLILRGSFPAAASEHLMLGVLALLALAVGIGAYPVVRHIASRLERLQFAVERLGEGDLAARVKVEGRDEVGQLAESFNRAAGQIESLVGAHKTLLANASHELRTPLARIRLAVELLKEGADARRKAGLEQDIAELDALIDEILLASRLDAPNTAGEREEVDLLALAAEEAARYESVQVDGSSCYVLGELRLLRRVVRNLLENARRHGFPPVRVRVGQEGGSAVVLVQDAGAGIPVTEFERVFEPFYRRTGGTENVGAGLGLALVRQIVRRHGGEVRCVTQADGRVGFEIRIPAIDVGNELLPV
jgi:signal transduction histidine kinase